MERNYQIVRGCLDDEGWTLYLFENGEDAGVAAFPAESYDDDYELAHDAAEREGRAWVDEGKQWA